MTRALLLAWAVVAALFCARLDFARRPLMTDNQLYFFMAERAASGVPPHVSMVDSKNDLGVLVTAAAIRAGRVLGADDVMSSRVVSIAFFAVAVAMAAELAALLAAAPLAGHVAAIVLLSVRGMAEHAAAGNNVKVFLVTFLLLAHVCVVRGLRKGADIRADVAAGLAAGAAFAVWQPALLVVAAVVFEALVSRNGGLRRALVIGAVSTLPFLACEAYFLVNGALGEQLHQAYVMTLGSLHGGKRWGASLLFLLGEAGGPQESWRVAPGAFAALALASLLAAVARPRRALALLRGRAGLASFVAGASASTAFTLYDHQGVPDLFFPDPYFAVGAGLLAAAGAALAARLPVLPRSAAPVAVTALAVAVVAVQLRADLRRRAPAAYDLEAQRGLADVVRVYQQEFGDVWVYGAVHLLGLAHLDNHVPYALFYDDVKSVLPIDTWRPLRDGRMPEVIVHTRGRLPGGPSYLLTEYMEITPPAFAAQGAMVWRRVAPQPAGLAAGDWRAVEKRPNSPPPAALPTSGAGWEKAHRPAGGRAPRPGRPGTPPSLVPKRPTPKTSPPGGLAPGETAPEELPPKEPARTR